MNDDWQDGYVAGLNYTYGYYDALNPSRARFALLNAGLVPPANLSACELGFGQGVSANLHAAASATRWFGTDFIAAQAGFAQQLAAIAGAEARLFDESFAEFCARPDLPDFDFIGLHGIWSWISDENRRVLVDFFRRRLKAGGVVYLSYNALPGSAAMIPVRDVLTRYDDSMGARGAGLTTRIDGAFDFTTRMLAAARLFSQAHPQIGERLKAVRGLNPSYIAHEYFNRNWVPMSFSGLAEWLAPAKLNYACSASYLDMVDALNLGAEEQAFLGQITDPLLRETVRDVMVNQVFRRDYWVKGARELAPPEKSDELRRQRIVLTQQRAYVSLTVKGALREIALPRSICDPILDALEDHRPKTLGQIEAEVAPKGISFDQVMELVVALIDLGSLAPAQDDTVLRLAKPKAARINAFLCDRARYSAQTPMLASPVTGGGVWVDRLHQFFLHAMARGVSTPASMAAYVLPLCRAAGLTILEQGRPLELADDNRFLAGVIARAAMFLDKELPVLQALQIV